MSINKDPTTAHLSVSATMNQRYLLTGYSPVGADKSVLGQF